MKNLKLNFIIIFSICFILSDCATVFSGTNQNINIKAIDNANNQDLESVKCIVSAGNGMTYVVPSNPGVINVKKGGGDLQVHCKKEGYKQINTGVGDSFNTVALVNVLFWPGALVDLTTGAYKNYPSHYLLYMERIK